MALPTINNSKIVIHLKDGEIIEGKHYGVPPSLLDESIHIIVDDTNEVHIRTSEINRIYVNLVFKS